MSLETVSLVHNQVRLALHRLRDRRDAGTRPLLVLHGLGERAPDSAPAYLDPWPGPIWGLDFTGHGASSVPSGGGYTAEILMADAYVALAHLGPSTVVGRGIGAYVGVLLAGARPEVVRGVLLTDGPGLVGGGIRPASPYVALPERSTGEPPDPLALFELSRDPRPPDYVLDFVRPLLQESPLETPIVVASVNRPEWLAAVVAEPGVVEASIADGLDLLRRSG